jgi:small-conductance mechanosensitive channel
MNNEILKNILISGVILFLGLFLMRLVRKIIDKGFDQINNLNTSGNKTPEQEHLIIQKTETAKKLIQNIVFYTMIFTIVVMIMLYNNINVQTLIVGAGITGLVVAMGTQDLIKDIVAGMFILVERSYLIGDFVEKNNVVGQVEDIGIKTTKIRTTDNTLMIIPNNLMLPVTNRSNNQNELKFSLNINNTVSIDEFRKRVEAKIKSDKLPIDIVGIVSNTDFSSIYKFAITTEQNNVNVSQYREIILKIAEDIKNEKVS